MNDLIRRQNGKPTAIEELKMAHWQRYRRLLTADELYVELERLQARIAELEKDAKRYQWIRQAGAWESEIGLDALSAKPRMFDEAVDKEMAFDENYAPLNAAIEEARKG